MRPGLGGETLRFSLAYFFLFAILGITSPYLQILLRSLGYGPAAVGLLLALFEVVGILGPLVLARLADAHGSYRLALICAAGATILAFPVLALVPRVWATVASLILLSLGLKTLIPVMDATGITWSLSAGPGKRRVSYGTLRALGSAGFIAMALSVQLLPDFDTRPPWIMALAAIIPALILIVLCLFLPAPQRREAPPSKREAGQRRRFDPVFALGLVVIGLSRLAMSPFASFLSLYAAEDLGLHHAGIIWALGGAAEIPLMVVSGLIIARLGTMASIAVGAGAIVLRLSILALVPTPLGLYGSQLLHSLCYGLFQPAAVAFVAQRVPPERRSAGMAVFMGLGVGLPTVLGSALGGFVVEAAGYRALFAGFTVFALGAIGVFLGFRKRFLAR